MRSFGKTSDEGRKKRIAVVAVATTLSMSKAFVYYEYIGTFKTVHTSLRFTYYESPHTPTAE